MERKLSVAERVMWMSSQFGCENCLFTTHVSGNLDESALRTALDLLARRHPLLATRIEVRGLTPYFISKGVPQIPLRVSPRLGDDDWHAEAERELNKPFSMSAGPLFRVVLLKSDESADVLFAYHHIIADGKSAINLVTEALQLTGEITGGNLSPKVTELAEHPPLEEILPRETRGVGGFLKAVGYVGRQLSNALVQRPSKLPKDSDAPSQVCQARFLQCRLSAQETRLLRVRGRDERTTIHGAVCAAILKAVAGQIHNSHPTANPMTLTCATAVDLRSSLSRPIKDEVGNFASIAITAHRLTPNTAFWNLATGIREDLKRAITRMEPAVSLSLVKRILPRNIKPANLINRIAKFNPQIMATNLGVMTIPKTFGPIGLRGFHLSLSMTAFPENVTAIIAIYQGQLEVTFCYSEPTLSRKRITSLMEDTIDMLQKAASLPTTLPSVAADVRTRPKALPVAVTVKG